MAAAKPKTRITSLVYGAYVALTTAFVAALVLEVASQVFGDDAPRVEALSPECAGAVRELYTGVNRGITDGLGGEDADVAVRRYRDARDEAWKNKDTVAATCAGEPRGTDAIAALARLDRRAEGLVRRHTIELGTVRREVDSFIRTPK